MNVPTFCHCLHSPLTDLQLSYSHRRGNRRTRGHTDVRPRVLHLQVADGQGSTRHDSPTRGQLSAFSSPADHRLGVPRCAAVQRHCVAEAMRNVGRGSAGKPWEVYDHKECPCCCGTKKIRGLTKVSVCITFVSRADGQRVIIGIWATGRDSARCPPPGEARPRVASHVTRGKSDVITNFDEQRSRIERQPRRSCGEERDGRLVGDHVRCIKRWMTSGHHVVWSKINKQCALSEVTTAGRFLLWPRGDNLEFFFSISRTRQC